MKRPTNFLALFALLLFCSFIAYQNQIAFSIQSGYTMKIKGSSNVHDWESVVEDVQGSGTFTYGEDGLIEIQECNVTIPVKSIKSSKGSIMDKNTWNALEESTYPTISFALTDFVNQSGANSSFKALATGKLTIAGVTKYISMTVSGNELANGSVEIHGSKDLKMTQFDVTPPTALLGTMKTADEITIEFNITLKPE